MLHVFDVERKRAFKSAPHGVASQRDFNTVEAEGIEPDVFESALSQFEDEAVQVIRRMDETGTMPAGDDRDTLMWFIALLGVHNPTNRNILVEGQQELDWMMMGALLSRRETWEAHVEKMRADGYDGPEVPFERMRDFYRRAGRPKILDRDGYHAALELETVSRIAPIIDARNWSLYVAKEDAGGFVTSDRPVTLLPAVRELAEMPIGYGTPGTNLFFPISKRVALHGSFEQEADVIPVNDFFVASINAGIAAHARRQVYASAPDFLYRAPRTRLIAESGRKALGIP